MNIIEAIRAGLVSIWSSKGRSFLTVLGMIIGVGSVITLVSIGKGVYQDVASLVEDMGTNIAFVVSGDIEGMTQGSAQAGFSNPANFISGDILTTQDLDKLRNMEEIDKVAPMSVVPGFLSQDSRQSTPLIIGSTSDIQFTFQNVELVQGRYPQAQDEHKKAIVLSQNPLKQLFDQGEDYNPVGEKIKLNQDEYEVIGVVKQKKTQANIISSDFDNLAMVPWTTANDLAGEEQIMRIMIKVKDNYEVKVVAEKIKSRLLESHSEDEISILTQEDMLDLMGDILGILTTMISLIAAISLIVGGVGIMNIMLVSVTERTAEIGIRKAIGATDGEILKQFLIEAVILTLLGGAIGVGLAYGAGLAFEAQTSISPLIDWQAIALASGISIGIGLIFGIFPAIRAAKKDPIEALRYE